MGLLGDMFRVYRAGKIKQDMYKVEHLDEQSFKSKADRKLILKLQGRIGRNEERNKIASEKSNKKQDKIITNNTSKIDSHNTEIVGAKVEQASLLSVNKESKPKSKKPKSTASKPKKKK